MPERTIPDVLQIFDGIGGGIESWLSEPAADEVLFRLGAETPEPLSYEYLNQLLILAHEAGHSRGFFQYYWFWHPTAQDPHPYDVTALSNYDVQYSVADNKIVSAKHLAWGLERLYVDGLLLFGNVRECYRQLRDRELDELKSYFRSKCYDEKALKSRGTPLPLESIPRDDRYLIAEVACKTYEAPSMDALRDYLRARDTELRLAGTKRITSRALFGLPARGEPLDSVVANPQMPLPLGNADFSFDEILDTEFENPDELDRELSKLLTRFEKARVQALKNTTLYLSMVYDLDVYVATSMRTRTDFRRMADRCASIFGHVAVGDYNLRFFDPTLSAAASHEDKGLVECLMVKCAKLLIYMAGEKESYGKDAEAAMALSLGKPVIFFCDPNVRTAFYRDVHPLSRLIDFQTGVAVGAIVTDKTDDVPILIDRILGNKMQYALEKKRDNYLLLREQLTGSFVRIQTDDKLLRETFWNYYHLQPRNGAQTNKH